MQTWEAVEKLGDEITASQMFACKNKAQGRVIALACLTTGRDILAVPEEYHLMNNKLTLQASAMLGRLSKRGGQYSVVAHGPERCAIKIEYNGRSIDGEITWADAQQEPFVYAGKTSEVLELLAKGEEGRKKLKLSANYATPRRRMQHLWARVVSDTVRVIAPELVTGSYTPEEVADYSGLVTPSIMVPSEDREDTAKPRVAACTVTSSPVYTFTSEHAPAVQEKPKAKQPAPAKEAASLAKESTPANLCSAEQVEQLGNLVEQLGVPDKTLANILSKRECERLDQLSASQANDLIAKFREKLGEAEAAQPSEAGSTVLDVNGPITTELEQKIRDKIKQVAQQIDGGQELAKKIRNKVQSSGLMLKDMRYGDADLLLNSLEVMEMEDFFSRQLLPASTDPGDEETDSGKEAAGKKSA